MLRRLNAMNAHQLPRLVRLSLLHCLAALSLLASESQPGSSDALRKTAFSFIDPATGGQITLFEAVTNEAAIAGKRFSDLRYYLSPLLHLVPYSPNNPVRSDSMPDGTTRLTLTFLNYRDDLFERAAGLVASQLASRGIQLSSPRSHLSPMEHMSIEFSCPELEKVGVLLPRVSSGSAVAKIPNILPLSVIVPPSKVARVQALMSGPLGVEASVSYTSVDVGQVSISWSASEIKTLLRSRDAATGGGRFVSAEHLTRALQSYGSSSRYVSFADPGVADALRAEVRQAFAAILADQQTTRLRSADDMAELERLANAGSGLELKDFLPIKLEWAIYEETSSTGKHSSANKAIKSRFERDFSAAGNVDSNWLIEQVGHFKAKYKHKHHTQGNADTFESATDFNSTKSDFASRKGIDVSFVERGIRLVERATIDAKADFLAEAIAFQPTVRQAQFTVQANLETAINPPKTLAIRRLQVAGNGGTNGHYWVNVQIDKVTQRGADAPLQTQDAYLKLRSRGEHNGSGLDVAWAAQFRVPGRDANDLVARVHVWCTEPVACQDLVHQKYLEPEAGSSLIKLRIPANETGNPEVTIEATLQ